ncbi:MAG: cytidylate kinase family protein [Thermodesulfobacteriota bacterium]
MAVITISRQAGSLGDEAAQALAQELGYHLVTRSDIHQLAAGHDPKFARDVARLEEEGHPGFWEKLLLGMPYYSSLYAAVICELAARDRVIIMGRGAQVVLKGVSHILRARVVAPAAVRVQRLMAAEGLSQAEAEHYLQHQDHERRELVRQVFHQDPRDWGLYHLVINSGDLDVTGVTAILHQALRELNRVQEPASACDLVKALGLGKLVEAKVRRQVLPTDMLKAEGGLDGTVTISGHLPADEDRKKALAIAAAVPGVRAVRDEIKVSRLPALY